jgi:hypothetical protein
MPRVQLAGCATSTRMIRKRAAQRHFLANCYRNPKSTPAAERAGARAGLRPPWCATPDGLASQIDDRDPHGQIADRQRLDLL